jgi:alpha-beta hydrolase superfamily lysophospholipase
VRTFAPIPPPMFSPGICANVTAVLDQMPTEWAGPGENATPCTPCRRADRVGMLSIEQALADYAVLIRHIRTRMGAPAAPVITFGASLAGSLAAFMRLKYPQIVDMAVASSAPVMGYPGLMDPFAWHKQVPPPLASECRPTTSASSVSRPESRLD